MLTVIHGTSFDPNSAEPMTLDVSLLATYLIRFLQEEVIQRRKMQKVVLGISGGLDSAVVACLCAKAFGPSNVYGFRMPYKISSPESLDHARLVTDSLGIHEQTIDITAMVDGYAAAYESGISPGRLGNLCARCRAVILFDQSAEVGGLPVGTGNKTERLFGYFTWHADDSPPINPLGDLLKTQVFELARYMGVPDVIVNKPPTADLIKGQTDEGDFGITFADADRILQYVVLGYPKQRLIKLGFDPAKVELVWKKVASTHWKRELPTVAVVSTSAIGEFYLRPVDY